MKKRPFWVKKYRQTEGPLEKVMATNRRGAFYRYAGPYLQRKTRFEEHHCSFGQVKFSVFQYFPTDESWWAVYAVYDSEADALMSSVPSVKSAPSAVKKRRLYNL